MSFLMCRGYRVSDTRTISRMAILTPKSNIPEAVQVVKVGDTVFTLDAIGNILREECKS